MIEVTTSGSFKKTETYLRRVSKLSSRLDRSLALDVFGVRGVDALSAATPVDTSETANSWRYKITYDKGRLTIDWTNDHVIDGQQIAVLIQYGHATGTGGYVLGRDYINPAIQPIFDEIAAEIWKQVRK